MFGAGAWCGGTQRCHWSSGSHTRGTHPGVGSVAVVAGGDGATIARTVSRSSVAALVGGDGLAPCRPGSRRRRRRRRGGREQRVCMGRAAVVRQQATQVEEPDLRHQPLIAQLKGSHDTRRVGLCATVCPVLTCPHRFQEGVLRTNSCARRLERRRQRASTGATPSGPQRVCAARTCRRTTRSQGGSATGAGTASACNP